MCIYHLCVYLLIENNYRRNKKIYRRDHKFKGGSDMGIDGSRKTRDADCVRTVCS